MERIRPHFNYDYSTLTPAAQETILRQTESLVRSKTDNLERPVPDPHNSAPQRKEIPSSSTPSTSSDLKQAVSKENKATNKSPKVKLKYYGGKLLKKPKFASIYLGSFWESAKGKIMRAYNDSFAKSYFASKQMGIWKEYGIKKGTFLGSDIAKPTSNPESVNDNQIQRIVAQEIAAGRVPQEDGQTVYTVYLPPGAVLEAPGGMSSKDGVGGYHMSFDTKDGKKVYYAAVVYSEGDNGVDFNGIPRDNITITSSHEWTEAATDPDVNNGKLGWYNETYGEVADIPLSLGLPLSEVYGKLDGYAVQKEWSNKDGQVELVPKD